MTNQTRTPQTLTIVESRVILFLATNIPTIEAACEIITQLNANEDVDQLLDASITRDFDEDGMYYVVTAHYTSRFDRTTP